MTRNRGAIAALAVIGLAVIAASGFVLALGVPKGVTTDQLAAIGTILGGGGFLFAIVATVVAVMAYASSLPRPDLYIASADQVMQAYPPEGSWGLKLTVGNSGQVAARFVAVRVTFVNWRWSYGMDGTQKVWVRDYSTTPTFDRVTWEGGADAVIHPTWDYLLPELGPLNSSLQERVPMVWREGDSLPGRNSPKAPSEINMTIEIVADRMRPKSFDRKFDVASDDG